MDMPGALWRDHDVLHEDLQEQVHGLPNTVGS